MKREPGEWKITTGGTPEKPIITKARLLRESAHSDIEHGKKTWTTGQSMRDILQNHLDACDEVAAGEILKLIIDTEALQGHELSPDEGKKVQEISYLLLNLRKYGERLIGDSRANIFFQIQHKAEGLPFLKKNFFNISGESLPILNEVEKVTVEKPRLTYLVYESSKKEKPRWVSMEELMKLDYHTEIGAVKIEERGSGFDAQLASFYASSKKHNEHARGTYGEGLKMSLLHLLRLGARVQLDSTYTYEDQGQEHVVLWRGRPVVDEGEMRIDGVEIEQTGISNKKSGSSTIIKLDTNRDNHDIVQHIDPRQQKFQRNTLDFQEQSDYYYYFPEDKWWATPVGVNVKSGDANHQYVQGILVENGFYLEGDRPGPTVSYDILDKKKLKGRDRNYISYDQTQDSIDQFWRMCDRKDLVQKLVARFLQNRSSEWFEFNSMYNLPPLVVECLGDAFIKQFNLNKKDRYFLSLPNETDIYWLTQAQEKGWTIIRLPIGHIEYKEEMLRRIYSELRRRKYKVENALSMSRGKEKQEKSEKQELANALLRKALDGLKILATQGRATFEIPDVNPEVVVNMSHKYGTTWAKPVYIKYHNKKPCEMVILQAFLEQDEEAVINAMQVYLLGIGNRSRNKSMDALLEDSQAAAQAMLDWSFSDTNPDIVDLPKFDHHIQAGYKQDIINPVTERLGRETELRRACKFLNKVKKFRLGFEEMEKLAAEYNEEQFAPEYSKEIITNMGSRVTVRDDTAACFLFPRPDTCTVFRMPLHELDVEYNTATALINNRQYNRLKIGNLYFVPIDTPDGIEIKNNKHHYFIHHGEVLETGHNGAIIKQPLYSARYPKETDWQTKAHLDDACTINDGCVVFNNELQLKSLTRGGHVETEEQDAAIGFFRWFQDMAISLPATEVKQGMKKLYQTRETPLPTEYGEEQWNNPERVLGDIIQNHIDAAEGGIIQVRYELTNKKTEERSWVTEDELTAAVIEENNLVGISIEDNGKGYPPDDIGTIGRSTKHNPFFAGKYGEGQKLLAAAAARNGVALTFSSFAEYNGITYEWDATVSTKNISLKQAGKAVSGKRVIFNIVNKPAESLRPVSATTLRFPAGGSEIATVFWEKIKQSVLTSDHNGNIGLKKFARCLQQDRPGSVLSLGHITLLLDQPGNIYENGLRVQSGSKEDLNYIFGYDVPEVVGNRERTVIDPEKIRVYIGQAMESCEDPRVALAVVGKIEKMRKKMTYEERADWHKRNSYTEFDCLKDVRASRPNWDRAVREYFSDRVMYPEGEEHYIKNFAISKAADLVRILPRRRVMHVTRHFYDKFCAVIPTVMDVAGEFRDIAVPASADTLTKLTAVVRKNALQILHFLAKTQTKERGIDYTARLNDFIRFISSKDSNQVYVAPQAVGYHGLALLFSDRMGINEGLLLPGKGKELAGTIKHELLHITTKLKDRDPDFIELLLRLAKYNTQQ